MNVVIKLNFLSGKEDIRHEAPVPDFIPYTCHISPETLLTKEGDILQILKIEGFTEKASESNVDDLRKTIRKVITEHVHDENIAIWLHTVRRQANLDPGSGAYEEFFPRMVHKYWSDKNFWHDKFINELYLTIVRGHNAYKFKSFKDFMKSLSSASIQKLDEGYRQDGVKALDYLSETLVMSLEQYGAKRLTVTKNRQGAFSEPLQFLGKIIHLEEIPVPLPTVDLAPYLATHKIAFGNDALEVIGEKNKHFAAVLTLKEFHDVPIKALEKFSNLPIQYVLSQSMTFLPAKLAKKDYQYQYDLLRVSGDIEYSDASGITDFIESDTGKVNNYVAQQLTLTITDQTLGGLEKKVVRASKTLTKLGYCVIREDVNLEACFWAQLPGNFTFINRKQPLQTKLVGGFCTLHNFPIGKLTSRWGKSVTLFRTLYGTPYFFNFHGSGHGHTLIFGCQGVGKMTLLSFLLLEARKYKPLLYMIDVTGRMEVISHALEGTYIIFNKDPEAGKMALNPCMLPDSSSNRAFLESWLRMLCQNRLSADDAGKIVETLFAMSDGERSLSALVEKIEDSTTKDLLKPWCEGGEYGHWFNHNEDHFPVAVDPTDQLIYGFNVAQLVSEPNHVMSSILMYLMHRMKGNMIEGSRSMLACDNFTVCNRNEVFTDWAASWLDQFGQGDGLSLFAMDNIGNGHIAAHCDTKIFFSTRSDVDFAYSSEYGLTDEEIEMLDAMDWRVHHFLVKQGDDDIVLELNLSGLDKVLSILSASPDDVARMREVIKREGSDPSDWLPEYYLHGK